MTARNLKQKAVTGIFWSFSDSMATQLVQFVVGLILARLLSPEEFGLIGMITVFLAVMQSIVDSGFGQALIRKQDADDTDYSTVFHFNLAVSIILFLAFYFSAPAIARFYHQPELIDISRVLGIIVLINATNITQRTQLTKKVDFKQLMKINLSASVISGAIAIIMALKGFGVWSLVWRSVTMSVMQAVLLWYFNRWIPKLSFSRKSFRLMFSFGWKLLLSGLIDTIYKNIYLLIIGKFFSATELGYYTRADQFSRLATRNLTGTVQRVSYPILSTVQDEDERLKSGYKKIIISIMFITFFIMFGMAAMAKPLVITLIGDKWLPSVEYLQLLCLSSMLYPLHAMNLNILNVKGRSDLFLRLEIYKKLLAVPVILAGIFLGIRVLLIGMIIQSYIAYFINSYYSGHLINYPMKEQIADILPAFLAALFSSAIVFSFTSISMAQPVLLGIQIIIFCIMIIALGKIFRMEGYLEIRNIIIDRMPKLKKIL